MKLMRLEIDLTKLTRIGKGIGLGYSLQIKPHVLHCSLNITELEAKWILRIASLISKSVY
jgi:hypothetical protein